MPDVPKTIVKNGAYMLGKALAEMVKAGTLYKMAWNCATPNGNNASRTTFNEKVGAMVNASKYVMMNDKHGVPIITAPIKITATTNNKSKEVTVGDWSPVTRFVQAPGYKMQDIKRFFRVGTLYIFDIRTLYQLRTTLGVVLGKPWAWIENASNPIDRQFLDYNKPNLGLKGYCIDLLKELARIMDFEYEIVPSGRNEYGKKNKDGSWTGVVGDLISGEIDISVATLTMTTEREEVIDFVAPYFDQSGISILLRKKEPKQSIFKFMAVLKPEVWLGILAAVFVVAFLIWALDRFSPYSYYNNK